MHMARHDALTDLPNRVLFPRADRTGACARRTAGDSVHRPRPLQDRQRHAGASGRRRSCFARSPSGCKWPCAAPTRSRGLAATSSPSFSSGQSRPTRASSRLRIIEALSEPFDVLGNQVVIGASIGIAIAPTDGKEPDQLLRNSDMALYRAKSSGRGTYHFFQPEMDAEMQARHALEVDLRKAMLTGEFEIYYQPIVDSGHRQDRRLRGARALEPSAARPDYAGRIHSAGGRNRPDRAARRMGAAPGLPRRRHLARQADGGGQSIGGAVPQSGAGVDASFPP